MDNAAAPVGTVDLHEYTRSDTPDKAPRIAGHARSHHRCGTQNQYTPCAGLPGLCLHGLLARQGIAGDNSVRFRSTLEFNTIHIGCRYDDYRRQAWICRSRICTDNHSFLSEFTQKIRPEKRHCTAIYINTVICHILYLKPKTRRSIDDRTPLSLSARRFSRKLTARRLAMVEEMPPAVITTRTPGR